MASAGLVERLMQSSERQVFDANGGFARYGLVTFARRLASAYRKSRRGLVVIKPSGVAYETMKVDDMVVVDMDSRKVVEEVIVLLPIPLPIWRTTHPALSVAWHGVVHTTPPTRHGMGARRGWLFRRCARGLFLGRYSRRALSEGCQGECRLNTDKVIIGNAGRGERCIRRALSCISTGHSHGKDAHDAVRITRWSWRVAKMAWIARGINPALNPIDDYLMNKRTSCVSMARKYVLRAEARARKRNVNIIGMSQV
ncbi:class II aldolase/adducin family protein [Salmonella enterica subsp. enterica]|nr:class II aldolase/adducin family protein [Salmonella enterica subsp. enterica]